jgi:nucleoside-diphosphate-sugar epimerase
LEGGETVSVRVKVIVKVKVIVIVKNMLPYNIDLTGKTVFLTGVAGFIGSNLAKQLLKTVKNIHIVGIDSMNDYYDVRLKEARLKEIEETLQAPLRRGDVQSTVVSPPLKGDIEGLSSFTFIRGNIADRTLIDRIFAEYHPQIVVNLAAQAGVRYSITNPDAYIESNLIGFYNILEACRHANDNVNVNPNVNPNEQESAAKVKVKVNVNVEVEHLIYASSSSVYGSNKKVPYSTDDKVDNPVSLYAATKKSNELLAHAYSKLYNIPSTGLRFFTVYGPAGRPDMAYFGFTNKLREGKTIQIFNYGNCKRDFTYVDDIVEGIQRVMQHAPEKKVGDDGLPIPPYKVYNIGNSAPENLLDFVTILQEELVRAGVLPADYDFEAHKQLVPMQPGDVPVTYADTTPLEQDFGFRPNTPLREGLRRFAEWYAEYYK